MIDGVIFVIVVNVCYARLPCHVLLGGMKQLVHVMGVSDTIVSYSMQSADNEPTFMLVVYSPMFASFSMYI